MNPNEPPTGQHRLSSFSAVMKFNLDDNGSNPVDEITDGQLVALAAQAYGEMKDLGRHTNQETPGTIGLLATNNVIYIASSVQGEGRGYWLGTREGQTRIDDRLLNAAYRCRIGGIHRNGGRCAELNLFDLYKARNEEIDLDGTHSRILAYGKFQNEPEKAYFPCTNDEGRWGCWTMLRALSNENPEDHLKDENLSHFARYSTGYELANSVGIPKRSYSANRWRLCRLRTTVEL